MGQLKVCFIIQHGSERTSFSNKLDMEQQIYSELLMDRFIDLEIRMKHAAAEHWLIQRLGQDMLHNLTIDHNTEMLSSLDMKNKKNQTL